MSPNNIIIYHNNNCSKSRQTLAYLRDTELTITVIDYLTNPPSIDELANLIELSGLPLSDFVRKNEPIYQSLANDAINNESALLPIMVEHPILIQRPIVKYGQTVIIARPPERVLTILPDKSQ